MQDFDGARAARLYAAAEQARGAAHAPYSRFPVGAALLDVAGRIFTGVNVENASYPLSMCAERNAIGAAVTAGARSFIAIAIAGGEVSCPPCGGCRQVLFEFSPEMLVVMRGGGGWGQSIVHLSALLPEAFTRDHGSGADEAP